MTEPSRSALEAWPDPRPLGHTTIEIGRIGLGLREIGRDPERSRRLIERAVEVGIRYFDVAPSYGRGIAEERLGAALADLGRDRFVVSTKAGQLIRPQTGRQRAIHTINETLTGGGPGLRMAAGRARRALAIGSRVLAGPGSGAGAGRAGEGPRGGARHVRHLRPSARDGPDLRLLLRRGAALGGGEPPGASERTGWRSSTCTIRTSTGARRCAAPTARRRRPAPGRGDRGRRGQPERRADPGPLRGRGGLRRLPARGALHAARPVRGRRPSSRSRPPAGSAWWWPASSTAACSPTRPPSRTYRLGVRHRPRRGGERSGSPRSAVATGWTSRRRRSSSASPTRPLSTLLLGATSAEELDECLALLRVPIPAELWADLTSGGFLRPGLPTSAGS